MEETAMSELAHSVQREAVGPCAAPGDAVGAGPAPPPEFTIASRLNGDRTTVSLCGELDIVVSQELQRALRAALTWSVRGIDLDLKGVEFCDCSGLNVLLGIRRQALEESKTVTVRTASHAFRRILRVTGTPPFPLTAVDSDQGPRPGAAAPQAEGSEEELRVEVGQLRRAMRTRPTIDLARGILMASFGLTPEGAWHALVMTSQNTNVKLHAVAQELVDTVTGEPLPEGVREVLSAAVAEVHTAPAPQRGGRGTSERQVRGTMTDRPRKGSEYSR
ncbi:ANTAR domain-containing protein [Streptomyces sp. NPDC046805]|uniref:ANTAR domain-containing protein n=1 Tax=Streptomyces sp. NPDC046805 TaxID=3155134 RepID=UPI00341029B0